MAFREVTILEAKEILRLWLTGVPKRRIALQLGLDVKTVRRYLGAARARGVEPAHGLAALDDALVEAVLATTHRAAGGRGARAGRSARRTARPSRAASTAACVSPRWTGCSGGAGSTFGYDTLRRFALAELGFGKAVRTVPVADCEPGEEVQLDTGWMNLLEPVLFGKRRRFRAWIFTAVLSRHRFVCPAFHETTVTAIEACEAAWDFFGGIFRVVIVDNTKTIVERADPVKPKLTRGFLEYAQARGFVIDTTRVRSPKDKAASSARCPRFATTATAASASSPSATPPSAGATGAWRRNGEGRSGGGSRGCQGSGERRAVRRPSFWNLTRVFGRDGDAQGPWPIQARPLRGGR